MDFIHDLIGRSLPAPPLNCLKSNDLALASKRKVEFEFYHCLRSLGVNAAFQKEL